MAIFRPKESLSAVRFFMVLSSLSPLFLLWSIQGVRFIDDKVFFPICMVCIAIPNAILLYRILIAKHSKDVKIITIGKFEDHREHVILYLFSMLLPFYTLNVDSIRGLILILVALSFIIYLLWHANFHYMNILFSIAGYKIYTIYSKDESNSFSGKGCNILISKRIGLDNISQIKAIRLSDTVFYEEI